MQLETKSLRKTINKAFLKETVDRSTFNYFKEELGQLLTNIESAEKKDEHEEHFKNLLPPFLNEVSFKDYYINTSVRIDLAIHTGSKVKDPVGVLLEVKRPSNKNEMITEDDFNRKAMHEAVLYYLEQRIEEGNEDLKHVVITDTLNWFVFDAQEFERCYYRPSALKKIYQSWKADQKISSNKDFMYGKIADFIDKQGAAIRGLHFDLSSYETFLKAREDSEAEKKLIPLYKFFSRTQLLKEPFANDSNTLNREFYKELLYILGLEEKAKSNTRYIERAIEGNRHPGSFIENTIRILDAEDHLSTVHEPGVKYGSDRSEQLFNVALELSIIWMNRLLFLKLLEAQLFRYHRQDKKFKFLKSKIIDGYDELNKLFFQVLARRESDRTEDINEKFGHIPYLNSSLFDPTSLEHQSVFISNLDDKKTLPVYNRSVLNDRRGDEMNTLEYLFSFLDAYDFTAEGGEEIQEERKTLINASVLGLIFEKINGYKDGSFFTPGFITEYMARETLRKTVADKFSEVLGFGPESPSPQTPLPQSGEGLSSDKKFDKDTPPSVNGGRAEDGARQGARGMFGATPGDAIPEELLRQARYLRRNQTEAEALLWKLLRNRQLNDYKFRRQHPIEEGVILDFYCHKAKLGIEVDGGYHDSDEQQAADAERTEILNEMGIRVVRFQNEEVLEETELVLEEIADELENPGDSPSVLLPRGRRMSAGQDEGDCLSFRQIYNRIGRDISIEKANEIVNSITICDPAVGSGHFLVSSLNELLAIKSDLGILCDRDGKMLRDVKVAVENDDLIVTYDDEELFEYDVAHTWHGNHLASRKISGPRQRIQKALFHEKRHMIENCLFGVDINANSVKICRLRLWIELLKNTYYTEESNHRELEVLPNIDINIKTGNSLVSRFELDSDISQILADYSDLTIAEYKEAVQQYKNPTNRNDKSAFKDKIKSIKENFTVGLEQLHPERKKLTDLRGKLRKLETQKELFGDEIEEGGSRVVRIIDAKNKIEEQKEVVQNLENATFFDQAFEWRFEFPEVLDKDGHFTGFDVVMGNPPYIRQESLKDIKPYLKKNFQVYNGYADMYQYFYELSHNVLRRNGYFSMITSNKFMRTNYGQPLRDFLAKRNIVSIIDFGELPVFEEASTFPCIIIDQDKFVEEQLFDFAQVKELQPNNFYASIQLITQQLDERSLSGENWSLAPPEELDILDKMNEAGDHLEKYAGGELYRGILTGFNEAFIIDEGKKNELIEKDPKSEEIIHPFISGDDVRFCRINFKNKYLITTKIGVPIENYPAVKKHLDKHKKRLKNRYDQGDHYWELRACSYYNHIEEPKIIFPEIAKESRFTFDRKGSYYINKTIFMIPSSDKYLLGILNSKLVWLYLKRVCSSLGDPDAGGRLNLQRIYVSKVPIINASKESKKRVTNYADQILTAKEEDPEADTTDLEAKIDRLVYQLYGLSEEEIAVVEESVA